MKKNKGSRGAVSVFLVMILVPCIVVSSVFVDLGRVHMSKSMAASSSDLALNSLMTNYDADLSEWYGMAASCQTIEEFYEGSAQFFLRTLSSQGLSEEEIILLSDYYADATSDDTIYDFLKMETQTAPSDMISAVDGANLTNAAFLKDQVVEFMKYRAPIEMTMGIIDRLQNDGSVMDALDCDENKELVENKTEYYEAEGELLAAALNSYIAIFDYYSSARAYGLTNDKLNGYVDKLTDYRNVYFEIHKYYVTNLCNTSGLERFNRTTKTLPSAASASSVASRSETVDGVTTYYIDATKINNLLGNLNTKIGEFDTAKNNLANDATVVALMNNLPGNGATQANAMQWWVRMNSAVSGYTSAINTKANEMLNAYAAVLAIDSCELEEGTGTGWQTTRNSYVSTTSSRVSTYLTAGVTSTTDGYLKAVKKLEEISSANYGRKSADNLYVEVDGEHKNLGGALAHIQTKLSAMRTELQGYVDLLDIAIDGNEHTIGIPKEDEVKSLDKLLQLANTYDEKKNNWSSTADASTTTMGEENRTEIADIERVCEELNETAVNTLKTRLTNIRSQIKAVISGIDSLKYGNKKLREISAYSTFASKADDKVYATALGLTNQELTDYATTTFDQLFTPGTNPVMTLSHTGDANYNPEIDPISRQVSTPELFVYFQTKFGGVSKQEVDKKKKELSDGETAGENKAKEAKEKGRYHGGGTDIAKDFSGNEQFNIADGAFSSIIDLFDCLYHLDLNGIRDDLYVTCYMMEMFSYATYENEGLYHLLEDDDQKELTLDNYGTKYATVMGDSADDEKKWLSEAFTDYYNKSLTNNMINKNNNAAYCAEVEYILYGGRDGKGNDDNVKSVYNNIYGIRYALNLVSGFANFWSGTNSTAAAIELIASTIFGVTGGIVPPALTKVILIPILTVFETSKDLDRLEAGFPVELYKKSHTDWWISIPSDLTSVGDFTSAMSSGAFNGPNQDKGIYYSDYLMVFVYLGLKSSAAEDMYQRMAEVIQANIRKLSGEDSYSMKKAQVYFKHEATIRVEPLMITLPIFNGFDNNMDTKTDWCTYKISTVRGYS